MYGMSEPPKLDVDSHSILLDFDGTLVDFAPHPDAIELRPGTGDLLRRLSKNFRGAVALVSGRRIESIDRFLAPLKLAAVGVHGQESRRNGGTVVMRTPSPEFEIARRRIANSLPENDPLLFEDKKSALVLHYRTCPEERGRALEIATRAIDGLAQLAMVEGHAIAEVRERNVSKADAVSIVAAWPEFTGRKPVFIGDDTTDEDGFRAAAEAGGFGVKVGAGETAARYRLADVGAVHCWLAMSAARQELEHGQHVKTMRSG
jgi:trehalose 6-phosphate phosphatase